MLVSRLGTSAPSTGVLRISSEDGNLHLLDGLGSVIWSSNVSSNGPNDTSVAQLQDTGNFVLRSHNSGLIIWQSFEHLTDTLLPQTTVSIQKGLHSFEKPILRSWTSSSDPSSGRYRIGINHDTFPELRTWGEDVKPYWRSGPWNGNHYLGIPYLSTRADDGRSGFHDNAEKGTVDMFYDMVNKSTLVHHLLDYDGNLLLRQWDNDSRKWTIGWRSVGSDCDTYGKCGPFGICNPKDSLMCSCLKGFLPANLDEWNKGNWTSGCVRRKSLQCNTSSEVGGFYQLIHVKVPDFADFNLVDDADECRRMCLENCLCVAYAYPKGIGCMMWNGTTLIDLQQFLVDGAEVFLRLHHSEITTDQHSETKSMKLVIAVISVVATCTVAVFTYYAWRWLRRRNGSFMKILRTRTK